MLRRAKEGLGWGMGGDGIANYSRGESVTVNLPKTFDKFIKSKWGGKLLSII